MFMCRCMRESGVNISVYNLVGNKTEGTQNNMNKKKTNTQKRKRLEKEREIDRRNV